MSSAQGNSFDFGARLKEAREARKLSQTELAKLANMQQSAVAHFEGNRRKPSFANVRSLAQALNISSDFLLGRTASRDGATTVFRGEENLTDSDRGYIQTMIDMLNQKKEAK